MARFLSLGAAAGLPLFLLAITMTLMQQQASAFLAPARAPLSSAQALRTKPAATVVAMGKDLVNFGDVDLDGSGCRVGIVKTRWNPEVVGSLYDGVRTALKECGVKDENVYDATVPGSFELPLATRFLAMSRQCDVVIAIGCLIKGETMHFEYISESVAKGLMDIQLQTTIPVIYGVLNCMTDAQAKARSTGENNHGISWGKTAVEMALMRTAALSKAPERATLPLTEKREETPADKKVERKFGF